MYPYYNCWEEVSNEALDPDFPFLWMAQAYAVHYTTENKDVKVQITCFPSADEPSYVVATYLNGKEIK